MICDKCGKDTTCRKFAYKPGGWERIIPVCLCSGCAATCPNCLVGETKNISVMAYTDSMGYPTCARCIPHRDFCPFLRLGQFGAHEFCAYTGDELNRRACSAAAEDTGTLIPCPACPVHDMSTKSGQSAH